MYMCLWSTIYFLSDRDNKESFDRSGPGRHSEKFSGRPDRGDRNERPDRLVEQITVNKYVLGVYSALHYLFSNLTGFL